MLEGPPGIVASRRLATNGRLIACASNGQTPRLQVRDSTTAEPLLEIELDQPAQLVQWLPGEETLAVAAGTSLRLFAFRDNKPAEVPPQQINVPGPLTELAASVDAQTLTACTTSGSLLAWKQAPAGQFEPLDLEAAPDVPDSLATTVALSPDGATLVAGDQDGGLRFWWLETGKFHTHIDPRRGQVAGIDVTPDGRYLLQVTHDRRAQIWDLEQGRALDDLGSGWLAGAIVADASSAVLLTANEGDPVQVDRKTRRRKQRSLRAPADRGRPLPLRHHRPLARSGEPPRRRWLSRWPA